MEHFLNHIESAERYYAHAVDLRRHDPGPQGKWLAGTLQRQGLNYISAGKLDLARQSIQEASQVLQTNGEKGYLGTTYAQLAYIAELQKDYAQANNYYQKCLDLMVTTGGKDDPSWQEVAAEKIKVLEKLGKKQEADDLRKQLKKP